MAPESDDPRVAEINEYLTRRRMLQGTGAAAAGLLAGCGNDSSGAGTSGDGGDGDAGSGGGGGGSGDSSSDGSNEDGSSGGGSAETDESTAIVRVGTNQMDQFHMNGAFGPANAITNSARFGRILFDPLVKYSVNTGEIHPVHAHNFEIDGQTAYVELREQTWHNGDPYTAESIALRYDIQSMINEHNDQETNMDRFFTDWEVENDYTIRFDLTQQWNPRWFAKALLDEYLYPFHPSHWNEWRDRLDSAGPGTDEFGEVLSELGEHTDVTVDGEQFVGYGPYKFETVEPTYLELSVYEDHRFADDIEYDRIEWNTHEDERLAWLEEQVDMVDTGLPFGQDLQNQMPADDGYQNYSRDNNRLLRLVMNSGANLPESQNRPTFEREIRHAISFTINRANAAAAQGQGIWEPWTHVDSNLHFNDIESDWFPADQFTAHSDDNGEPKLNRAEEMVRASEGYSYEGGTVLNENGEQAELVLLTADFPSRVPAARSMASDLNSFGWDVTLDIVDDPTFVDRRRNGEFDTYIDPSSIDDSLENWKSGAMLGYDQRRFHYPTEVEVPSVGEAVLDPENGSLQTVDLSEVIGTMESTTDTATQQEVLTQLGWVWNQYQMATWVCSRPWMGALHNDGFEITTDEPAPRDSPSANWWLLREGHIATTQ
ncbi:ABC transporter substrate-binding protein [Halosimplex halophilum]|uniref:ABC transporter substrate-binding protein n=1 Tax=Halosimplex halophilum TaxID=2559572 RepID=UPI00107F1917|nr:ABC transporter substrate-binding protein [Halosimplex halophilum]